MNEASHEFEQILGEASRHGIPAFSGAECESFSRYFSLVRRWNDRLHLTTLSGPREFAERHVFEAAFAAQYLLPEVGCVWDLGSGLGVPGIPFAILRPDLHVTLVEAQKNKAIFLKDAVAELRLPQVEILNSRLETIETAGTDSCVTARALERMESLLPEILRLGSRGRQMLIFGGLGLLAALRPLVSGTWNLDPRPLPLSEQRLVIELRCFT